MKKSILTLSLLALFAGACKKSSSDSPQSAIVGKWYLKKSVTTTHSTNQSVPDNTQTNTGYTDADWMQFNSNGTWQMSADLVTNGSTGTYSVSGNQLTTQNGTGTIKTLDAHTLIIDSQEVEGNMTTSTEETYTK